MDEKKYSIIAKNISKVYKMYSSPKQKLLDLISPKGAGKTFYALKDISFKVEKGEVVGLLGLNGAGKSTLSNILGGVSMPSSGEIEINGEASLIAIGIGMNNFLTGIENIELKAIMMGYKKKEIEEIKQEIIDFADIGEFINQPLRTYSSGMRSRLGFAISVYTNPDILVIDEALSVGDPTFTQKCLDKMNEFKESGKTIFFVSHSLSQIKKFCNKALWLEYGRLKEYGDVEEVLPKYQEYINEINKLSAVEKVEYKKKVLENHEHSLLRSFKIMDKNNKKFKKNGKILKSVTLINDKKNAKEVFFNIDIATFAFGFIPSLVRKRYETSIFILLLQILNLFIVSFPFSLITNLFVTGIASIITGKGYIDYLIENKKFIPYNIWMKVNNSNKEIEYKIVKRRKENKIIAIICSIFIALTTVLYSGYTIKNLYTNNNEIISVENYMIVLTAKSNDKEIIDSLLILNSKNNKLNGITYPGKIQVSVNNNTDTLAKLVSVDNIESLIGILSSNFKINVKNYIVINKDELKNESIRSIDAYKEILLSLLSLDENVFENKKKEIINKYPQIDENLLEDFYSTFNNKDISINEVKYKTIKLGELIEEEVLKALNMIDKENYEFITLDARILQNNAIIKNINKKYAEYLENEKEVIEEATEENLFEEEIEIPSSNNGGGIIGYPPSNNGGSTTVTPPSNNGGVVTPPNNNGGVEIPPSDNGDIETPPNPPSDNEGVETPPSDNGGAEPPPSDNGGVEPPPSDSGEVEDPPVDNGGGEIPPSNNGGVESPPNENEGTT